MEEERKRRFEKGETLFQGNIGLKVRRRNGNLIFKFKVDEKSLLDAMNEYFGNTPEE